MKILTTQLTGLFQRLAKEEEAIEDTARLLAQAIIGEGRIHLAAFGELEAVAATALNGPETLESSWPLPFFHFCNSVCNLYYFV